MKVLVIGAGGREHAILWALKKSPQVTELLYAPGNGGTAQLARNIPVDPGNLHLLVDIVAIERGPWRDTATDFSPDYSQDFKQKLMEKLVTAITSPNPNPDVAASSTHVEVGSCGVGAGRDASGNTVNCGTVPSTDKAK